MRSYMQLTRHLWVVQSRTFYTNSGVIINAGGACLVDPCMHPDELEDIARFVQDRHARPELILLTHSHWDHILGPERFPGVHTVAHANYLKVVQENESGIRRAIGAWEAENGIHRAGPFTIPRPGRTFDDTLEVRVGILRLHLEHAPGHAPDQFVIYHTESGVLWAADMLSDLEIPFVSDNLLAYQRTLDRLSRRDIQVLVPGHGHATTDQQEIQSRLAADIAYLAELSAIVGRAVRQNKTLEETIALCSGMRYHHPAENAGPHRLNVESAYVEFGGAADAGKAGWALEGA